jgi:hypothetical protein
MNEIDYSAVPTAPARAESEDWEAPTHKFFGKKLPNGKTEKEPVYTHIEYPRLMYAQKNGKIVAKIVQSDAELNSLGEGWEKNPSAFGYIGAPSFEQRLKMEEAKAAAEKEKIVSFEEEVVQAVRRGRPPKAT